jgi:hypothetical protein
MKTCPECAGGGVIECSECLGEGGHDCSLCNTHIYCGNCVGGELDCPSCGGLGEVEEDTPNERTETRV